MKKSIVLLIAVFFIGITEISAQAQQVQVKVDGLSCPFCAYGLEKKLTKIDGVEKLEIDIKNGLAVFTVAQGKTVSEEALKKSVKEAGFTPREITYTEIPKTKNENNKK